MQSKNKKLFIYCVVAIFVVAILLISVIVPQTIVNKNDARDKSVLQTLHQKNSFMVLQSKSVSENASVERTYYANFDAEFFNANTISVQDAQTVFVAEVNNYFNKFKLKVNEVVAFKPICELIKSGVKVGVPSVNKNSVNVKVVFADELYYTIFRMFEKELPLIMPQNNATASKNLTKGLFVNTQKLDVANLFLTTSGTMQNLFETLVNYYATLNIKNFQFFEGFKTDYVKYYSNCNYTETNPLSKTFVWSINPKSTNQNLYIYYYYTNQVMWYVVALCSAILLVIVLNVINIIKKRKQNKNKTN